MPREKRIKGELSRDHVLAAMDQLGLDQAKWPRGRASTKFDVIDPRNGMRYPPKLVLSLAVKLVDGVELPLNKHSGGKDSNGMLEKLDFKIEPKAPPSS